jgi:hypothetical protein
LLFIHKILKCVNLKIIKTGLTIKLVTFPN